jgi:hypothetical protein
MADLDPAQAYTITITNDGGGELGFTALHYAKAKRGPDLAVLLPAVIVPAVAVVVGVGALVWWRRRRAREERDDRFLSKMESAMS